MVISVDMTMQYLGHRLPAMLRSNMRIRRWNSTYQPPDPPRAASNAHRDFYKNMGRPVFKSFLIAVCTFQAIYWSWLKLESLEIKENKDAELHSVEEELRSLTKSKAVS